jgi:hypothetical protein
VTLPRLSGHRIKRLALCLFWGDLPEGGMEPMTMVVSFDGGERVSSAASGSAENPSIAWRVFSCRIVTAITGTVPARNRTSDLVRMHPKPAR